MTRRWASVACAVGLLAAACGDRGDAGAASSSSGSTVRVFAASSLQGAFTELADRFERASDGIEVDVTFGGSSALAAQIVQGAPADVFASADEATMAKVVASDATKPVVFARNRLVVIVEPGNPKDIDALADLARPDVAVVLCAPAVPCGRLANRLLATAAVDVRARSLEENVTAVRSKVALGEADAGVVYATDVAGGTDPVAVVDGLVPDEASLEAVYPIVVLDGAPEPAAHDWVRYVRSDDGRAVLERLGFRSPAP